MTGIRRAWMWAGLIALAALVVFSITGAFAGTKRAEALFNSVPAAVYWAGLGVLLVGGFVCFAALVRRPGLLAAHLGVIFILAGGMWGSAAGHRLRARLRPPGKIRKGRMVIYQGYSDNRILSPDLRVPLGRLDFEVKLEKFWIEYYPPAEQPYLAGGVSPVGATEVELKRIDWQPGRPAPIPFTDATVKVLQFLPSARMISQHMLQVRLGVDETHLMPIRPGAKLDLGGVDGRITIVRIFENLKFLIDGGQLRAVDRPGEESAAAVEVLLESADGQAATRYVYSDPELSPPDVAGGFSMQYVIVPAAEPDDSSTLPACKLELVRGKRRIQGWLTMRPRQEHAPLPLIELFPSPPQWHQVGRPTVFLVRPPGPIRDWKSRLVIRRGGKVVARKVVEVNHPLHYGGYHFYQFSWDRHAERYTVLSVVSDDGLWAVYAGFVLLCAGIVWRFWLAPAWHFLRRAGR